MIAVIALLAAGATLLGVWWRPRQERESIAKAAVLAPYVGQRFAIYVGGAQPGLERRAGVLTEIDRQTGRIVFLHKTKAKPYLLTQLMAVETPDDYISRF